MSPTPEARRRRHLIIIIVAIASGFAIVGAAVFVAISQNSVDAASAKDLAVQIQKERRDAILRNCQAQNARNHNTRAALDDEIAKLPPKERRRARRNIDGTIRLINALQPYQNCEKLVEDSVSRSSSGH